MRLPTSVVSALAFASVGLAAASCGGAGTPAEKIRPKEQTFAGAMGEAPPAASSGECREIEGAGEPLVVDWKPEQRGDLEILMKEGVAVVSYSCKGLKLLKDCRVDGKYGFLGMTRKEQLVRLTNADEVKANLPLAGIGLAANIGAEMQRGATLDVALVMVGKVKTTWATVAVDELKGECDGATHFVKGAVVGAFVMETGTKGEARTAAQLFGAGASASSTSAKSVRNQDGDINDCAKAQPDAPKAPPQCQAMVRLELKPLAAKAAAAENPAAGERPAPETKTEVAEPTCPKGMVLAQGKCTAETKAVPAFQCKATDVRECLEQCNKGHAGSCFAAGTLHLSGKGGASRDEAKARELLGKGCEGAVEKSCVNLGILLRRGIGGPQDPSAAVKLFEKACDAADPIACANLGSAYLAGEGVAKDEAKAVGLLTRGCEGGEDSACGLAGKMLLDGRGTAKDVDKAADFLKRACDGSDGEACNEVGQMREGRRDTIGARIVFQRGCLRGSTSACVNQGRLELGQGGSQDNAKRAFERACTFKNHPVACAAMKVLYGANRPFIAVRETADANRACMRGGAAARDCGVAALLNLASGNKPMAEPQIQRACTAGDPLACALKNKK